MTDPQEPAESGHPAPERDEIKRLIARIQTLEGELEDAFEKTRTDLRLRIEHNRAVFEEQILKRHRELRVGLWKYIRGARLMVVLTAPAIYGLIVPIALLDLCVSIYQAVCFPVYRIDRVRRADYVVFDRQNLAYLNALEKLNCAYCSYANGVFAYVREVAARTEKHWCPIKHMRRLVAPHAHYAEFAEYGDADAYRAQLDALRRKLTDAGA